MPFKIGGVKSLIKWLWYLAFRRHPSAFLSAMTPGWYKSRVNDHFFLSGGSKNLLARGVRSQFVRRFYSLPDQGTEGD